MIKNVFRREEKQKSDFSDFFINAKSGEKKKLLKEVIRKANEDQKNLVSRYDRMFSGTSS